MPPVTPVMPADEDAAPVAPAAAASSYGAPASDPDADPPLLSTVEREHILRALQHARGNKKAAARMLGVSRRALYRRLERLGLDSTISRRSHADNGATTAPRRKRVLSRTPCPARSTNAIAEPHTHPMIGVRDGSAFERSGAP